MGKKEFKFGDRVRLFNLGESFLEGSLGVIYGKASEHILDSYIVVFDRPLWTSKDGSFQAVVMTEACLERV